MLFLAEDITDKKLLSDLNEGLTKINVSRFQLELNSLIMVGPTSLELDWG